MIDANSTKELFKHLLELDPKHVQNFIRYKIKRYHLMKGDRFIYARNLPL
jgi:hypothetical protein